jgi:quinol monooxygenase YgiN
MLIVIGDATAAPGRRDELTAPVQGPAASVRVVGGTGVLHVFVRHRRRGSGPHPQHRADRSALDAHLGHEHTTEFMSVAPGRVAGEPAMAFYDVDPT